MYFFIFLGEPFYVFIFFRFVIFHINQVINRCVSQVFLDLKFCTAGSSIYFKTDNHTLPHDTFTYSSDRVINIDASQVPQTKHVGSTWRDIDT